MSFLYKPLSEYDVFGIDYSFEAFYDLNIKAYLDYTQYSYDDGISAVVKKNRTNFGLNVSYGVY